MEHCSHICDMKLGISRATATFGPHDNFNLSTCHVVPALIKRVLSGENPFTAWGSPDVVRDFLYIKDLIIGIIQNQQQYLSEKSVRIEFLKSLDFNQSTRSKRESKRQ